MALKNDMKKLEQTMIQLQATVPLALCEVLGNMFKCFYYIYGVKLLLVSFLHNIVAIKWSDLSYK